MSELLGMTLLWAILVLGCAAPSIMQSEMDKSPEGWILIIPTPPKPKTFIEQKWPHWEKSWPSNRVPVGRTWTRPPLQVV